MSPVIASVSSIGTPALISWPIVCSERLMYSDRNIAFTTGIGQLQLVHPEEPSSVRVNA
jgi:hypothetical protein